MDGEVATSHESAKKSSESEHSGQLLPDGNEDPLVFLKSLAEASAVFVALTFIDGWSYLASYYSAFGLDVIELDVPVPVVCTTAVYVLFRAKWPLAVVIAFTLGCIIFRRQLKHLWRRGVAAAILALLFFTISTTGVFYGRQRANNDMLTNSEFDELPYVAFASKLPKTDQPPCVEYQTYGSFDCKLLLHSKGAYYFFLPVPAAGEASTTAGSLNVFILSDSDVSGVHILRGLDRNVRSK